ncbi:uncharacterized protein K452DRAFT_295695 [Aplosporella prunicola CBS 121167]|uniref:DASH complex subunit DUO1 n=1 Tax=Aplosporella prunicola CBS 121167 TaxID=1176127 RepID=A0A6A6BPF4_9PEZI|nr:uncharacterized protein K452DRAFT_295695 [Aplosporella prunicola CBS 121167]KAF2145155.1 hypothetical protein K452DRAFT_295695 [Aplosporella prunicola CBS 121167]
MATPNMDDLTLSDSDINMDSPKPQPTAPRPESRYTTDEAREAALRRELDQVRSVNKVIEGVVESLDKARTNMDTVHRTVSSASTLLHTWTRILSATEHNQRLILDPTWQGAGQDVADTEAEASARQHEAARREQEAVLRREAAARRAEEDEERRRVEAAGGSTSRPGSSARGTRRGTARGRAGASATGRTTPGAGYVGVGGQRGVGRGPGRAGSGIGRGGVRGRGRA